jgi:UDP-4-amino-4,6-dideoxy-N-acetyl-beta-L-altrosamine transaminase
VRGKESILAIHGGQPVRETQLPYGHQEITENDIQEVVEVLRSDWITTGPKVGEFESDFAGLVGAKYAVSFSSGTAALHGSVFAAGLRPGDEAVTSPMTFCASSNCLLYQGAEPIFADICPDTLNIDPDEVARRITPKTKAIIPVDYAGHPADLKPILDLADRHGLVVIEDACHALGAEYRGKQVGSISHLTVFSFHPVKHITTGEGGMVTTDNEEFAHRLRLFRNHGIESDARQRQAEGNWHYEMIALGYNYRLTDIGCGLGISQLRRLSSNLARRREIAEYYHKVFTKLSGLIPIAVRSEVKHAWHLYPIRFDLAKFKTGRSEIIKALRAEGLGVNVHYIPVHLHPYYRERFGYHKGDYPNTENAYESLITLPLFHTMNDQDVDDVIQAVRKVTNYYGN